MSDWETKKVKDVFNVQLGKMLSKKAKEGEMFPYLANFNVQWGRFDLSKMNEMNFSEREKTKYELKKNDLLMCEGGEIGRCAVWQEENSEFFYQKALHRLRAHNADEMNPYYFYAYMQHICANNTLVKIAGETSIAHFTREKLLELKFRCPKKPRQDQIVYTLQTWDAAIEKTQRLIAAKERQFGWFIHYLVGQYQYSNKWDEFLISDIFDVSTHSSKSSSICEDGTHYIIDMGSISRNGDLVVKKRTNFSEDMIRVGELVMPKDDIGGGNIIGKVAIIDCNNKYICGDHVYRLNVKSFISSAFAKYVINSVPVNKRLRAKANGTSQLGLGKKDVLKQPIWLPELSVQQNIAKTLTTAKQEINLLKKLADQYRMQKRGLIQKLLTEKWELKI